LIKNKVDLTNDVVGVEHLEHQIQLSICAKHSKGVDLLKQKLSEIAGTLSSLVRSPAVSIILSGMPLMCIVSFNTSRVVPAISVTIALALYQASFLSK
jgi:hypothetical protein